MLDGRGDVLKELGDGGNRFRDPRPVPFLVLNQVVIQIAEGVVASALEVSVLADFLSDRAYPVPRFQLALGLQSPEIAECPLDRDSGDHRGAVLLFQIADVAAFGLPSFLGAAVALGL